MNKKVYEAPAVKIVHLEIKNAVLALCHSSTGGNPYEGPCRISTACYYGAPGLPGTP
jgi:hypothetical protein